MDMSSAPAPQHVELTPAVKAILEGDTPKAQLLRHYLCFAEVILTTVLSVGCGGMNSTQVTPAESIPNATITGQYDLILTSMNGHGTTNIYTSFTETGASLTGAGNTVACPSNNPSQCQGQDASGVSITPNGTVSGTDVTIVISIPTTAKADTVTMTGTRQGKILPGHTLTLSATRAPGPPLRRAR